MNKRLKKAFGLIIFVIVFLLIACIGIPLVHDILFDNYSVSNYEIKEGIVSDVIMKNKKDVGTCENIIIDDYNIFVKCGDNYEGQFSIGDKTEYYVYKNKGYYTESQMKSGSIIGKILDYGMIGSYILLLCLIMLKKEKLSIFINKIAGK